MALQSLVDCFQDIEDPRVERTRHHQLNDILVLSVLAVMSGAEGWEDIEDYASVRLKWLRQIIPLRNGVPSHDTISRGENKGARSHCFSSVGSGCTLGLPRGRSVDSRSSRRAVDSIQVSSPKGLPLFPLHRTA
jgi:hypothetical protein